MTGNLVRKEQVDDTGGGPFYTNAEATPETIGGIESGSTFTAQTMEEMWDELLYPYQVPSFSTFSFNAATTVEVGETISGTKTFTWTTTNDDNINVDSLEINDVTHSSLLGTGLTNDGTEDLAIISTQKVTPGNNVWSIEATDSESTVFSKTYTISWLYKKFYGKSSDAGPLSDASIKALANVGFSSSKATSFIITTAAEYIYISYPKSFGTASFTINGLPNTDWSLVDASFTNDAGNTYDAYTYRTNNVLTGTWTIVVS